MDYNECFKCKKSSQFLKDNKYCQCSEFTIKQRYNKKYGKPPIDNQEQFLKFAVASYNGSYGRSLSDSANKVGKIRKSKSKNVIINSTKDFFNSQNWKELRFIVLKEGGYKCVACGVSSQNKVLHVDHIKPISKYPELALDKSNLQVLCEDCNFGKSNY